MSISNYNVKLFCCEDITLIEGYEEAVNSDKQYDCHHRLELHSDCSTRFSRDSLKKLDLYFNRPARELIFIEHSKHMRLHRKGNILSEETKKKLSESHKGKPAHNKGIPLTEEHKKHLSESLKGRVRTKEANAKFKQTMTGRKRKPFTEEWKHNMGNFTRGKTWKLINGKRVWFEKEA